MNLGIAAAQSFLALFAVLLGLLLMDTISNAVVIASIGASAFIIFATPKSDSAKLAKFLPAYVLAGILGVLCDSIPNSILAAWALPYHNAFVGAFAVGLSTFFMVLTGCKHPPAAAFALGLVLQAWSPSVLVMTFAVLMVIYVVRCLFYAYLVDL